MPDHGPATTVCNRFNRWSHRGILRRIFVTLSAQAEVPDDLSIDSTAVRAHRFAHGGKGGRTFRASIARPAIAGNRREGALAWRPHHKIHALTDACGRRVAFILGPGNGADLSAGPDLPDKMPAACPRQGFVPTLAPRVQSGKPHRGSAGTPCHWAVPPTRRRPCPHAPMSRWWNTPTRPFACRDWSDRARVTGRRRERWQSRRCPSGRLPAGRSRAATRCRKLLRTISARSIERSWARKCSTSAFCI